MQQLLARLRNLWGAPTAGDDHLAGAVDLSDSAYCFDLLGKHGNTAASFQAAAKGE